MEFGLKVNPGLDARSFLENKIEKLGESNFEQSMNRLNEDIRLIFTGQFEKLKKDSRFKQVFLMPRVNLRMEKISLGETFIGAFAVLEKIFNERIAAARGKEERKAVEDEYFNTKLAALEKLFVADISKFEHYFILMFLRYTYQEHLIEGGKLDQIKTKFKEFISEEKTLLKFFYLLDEFNNLNIERGKLDREKKTSLSQRLEDQIKQGEPIKSVKRQIVICQKLKAIAEKLIEISSGHSPLDEIRRVLDEIYVSGETENVIKGILGKFSEYYQYELSILQEALVYEKVLFMNTGAKEAGANRKKWIGEMDFGTVERLVNLLEVKDTGQRLSHEQKERQELFEKFREKIDANRPESTDSSQAEKCLDEGEMNLLILHLSSASLEEQISKVDEKLQAYRKKNCVDYQNNIIRAYNGNIDGLAQALYFFLELFAFKKTPLESRGREVLEEVKKESSEMEKEIKKKVYGDEQVEEMEETQEEEEAGKEGEKEEKKEEKEKEEEEEVKRKLDLKFEKDPEKRAELLAKELKNMPDPAKIKPLKELAYTGGMETLKYILPLSQYTSDFLRNMARNAVIKIVLRLLRENEEKAMLGLQQRKKLIDFVVGLEQKYAYLRDMELTNPKTTKKVLDILIREDKDFTAKTLSEILVDEDEKVRAAAVKMIADMLHQKEASLLMKMLSDNDPRVRANVIESLEAVGNRNVLGILMKYKYDKDNRARANALKAIWNFGNKEIADSLEDMLVSPDPKMRASGVWLIGEIGHDQPSIKALLKAVKNDKDEMVQDNLRKSLTKITKREQGIIVLMADDDLEFCKNICLQLKKDGFRPSAAGSGKTALAKIEEQVPDIVLMDLRMPEMNGLEALKAIRANEATKDVPVIMMSDLDSSVLLKQVSKFGANDYLLKPCSYEQVKEKVQNYL